MYWGSFFSFSLSFSISSTTVPRRAGELARKRVLAEPPPTSVRRAADRIERLVPSAGGVGVVVAAAAVVAELRRPIEGSRLRRPREVVEVRGGAAGVAVAPCCSEEAAAIVRLLPTVRGEAADDDEDGRVGVRGGGEEVEVARLLREGLAARREDDDAFRLGVVSCARAREPPVEREVELDERWLLPLLAPDRDVVEALFVAWRVFGDVDNVAAPSPSCCSVEDSSVSSGTRRGEVIV